MLGNLSESSLELSFKLKVHFIVVIEALIVLLLTIFEPLSDGLSRSRQMF